MVGVCLGTGWLITKLAIAGLALSSTCPTLRTIQYHSMYILTHLQQHLYLSIILSQVEQSLLLALERLTTGRGVDMTKVDRVNKRLFRDNFAECVQTIRSAIRQ